MESKLYDTEAFLKNFDNTRNIAIIGRGEGNTHYKFNPHTVQVFAINDSCLFYPDCEYTAIVQAHYEKNYPIVKDIIPKIVKINKPDMLHYDLVTGCTPSILISLLIKHGKLNGKKIYLQGFPLMGPSHDQKFLYDFVRQQKAFIRCFDDAKAYGVDMMFVTPCERIKDHDGTPEKKDIIF